MVKNLVKHGNSWALIIDKPILDLLNITPDTPLEISTQDGRSLHIEATAGLGPADRTQVFQVSLADINARFATALKRLAS